MRAEKTRAEKREHQAIALEVVAAQIKAWNEWTREQHIKELLETPDDTSIMALPVPMWPSVGQFKLWIMLFEEVAKELRREP